ncbi:hypothetical protein C8Q74DRAFT_1191398 [Fomes fomentarius]|nr:hypothetical protein C8Q74DRAFT_1191398 [Fomes fomentarius]
MSLLPPSAAHAASPLDPPNPSVDDIFAHHGRQIIARFINHSLSNIEPGVVSSWEEGIRTSQKRPSTGPVGILGAGATGLYTALILLDLGIPFKIIEASERVGGRLFTYTFPNTAGEPYNYYDVGAMRFPEIISMKRVFHLFKYQPLNEGNLQLRQKLRPYYFAHQNALMSYNGETLQQSQVTSESFQPQAVIRDVDPTPYIRAGYKRILADVVDPFARGLYEDLMYNTTTGWEHLKKFDHYSARAYMQGPYEPSPDVDIPIKPLSTDVVNWMETFDNSTGAYDRALTEVVLETIAFGWKPSTDEETKWWCIDGGAYQIADVMYRYIQRKAPDAFTFNARVTGVKTVSDGSPLVGIDVTTDSTKVERFSHVITSIPLPVLRTVDLTEARLTPMQSNAVRQLTYGPSTKIGMQFRTAWWTTATNKAGIRLNIIGGQTYSDSPIRTIVYPSFGDVQEGKTTTLIASYCWTDDADRLGALTTNDSQKSVLVELVLRELARIHNLEISFLRGQLLGTHAWSWSHDPYTMGAFAHFGPGRFNSAYESLTAPAGAGRLHFAGEAISTRHAWVEGALDSAWRAVYELLVTEPAWRHLLFKFFHNWGYNAEWFAANEPGQTHLPSIPGPGWPKWAGPLVGVPYGQWNPGMDKDENGEPDVEKLWKSSLLVKRMAVAGVELGGEEHFPSGVQQA